MKDLLLGFWLLNDSRLKNKARRRGLHIIISGGLMLLLDVIYVITVYLIGASISIAIRESIARLEKGFDIASNADIAHAIRLLSHIPELVDLIWWLPALLLGGWAITTIQSGFMYLKLHEILNRP